MKLRSFVFGHRKISERSRRKRNCAKHQRNSGNAQLIRFLITFIIFFGFAELFTLYLFLSDRGLNLTKRLCWQQSLIKPVFFALFNPQLFDVKFRSNLFCTSELKVDKLAPCVVHVCSDVFVILGCKLDLLYALVCGLNTLLIPASDKVQIRQLHKVPGANNGKILTEFAS
jgi:hypothetical protein